MAYYSEDAIEEIISNTDVVELIGSYVPLKRRGANYIGLCPFHREKTPSFTVSSDKQIFKCFGCSEGGSAIQFVKKIENLDFRESLEFLADRNNIDLSRFEMGSTVTNTKIKDEKERLFLINKSAAKYFYEALTENIKENTSILKDYLIKRELDSSIITRFGIGFGSKKQETLYDHLIKEGYTKEEMQKAGVVGVNIKGYSYENFANRLIFPIIDTRDRVIGFGGRVLDNSLPKYVNSPENIIYHKGRNLYGLNIVRREKLNSIIIVEGYMDTIALHKAGIKNVVASLGTALTENQAKLIKKHTDTVILAYDQDEAGKKATLRAIDILYKEGLKVKVLILDKEDAKDPDEYILKYGNERLKVCLNKSLGHVNYRVKELEKNLGDEMDSKLEFLNNVATILARIENNIEREMHIHEITSVYKISKGALEAEINKKLGNKKSIKEVESNIDMTQLINRRESSIGKKRKQELYVISILLSKDRKTINKIQEIINEKDFENEEIKKLYIKLIDLDNEHDITKGNILKYITDDDELKLITEVMCTEIIDKDKFLQDLSIDTRTYRYNNRRMEILKRLSEENITKDEKEMLSIELNQIIINKGKLR